MTSKKNSEINIKSYEITEESVYLKRRDFVKAIGLGLALLPQHGRSNAGPPSDRALLTHSQQMSNKAPPWMKQKI